MSVRHPNNYPTRVAAAPDGRLYVSDANAGSVFIYDSSQADKPSAELSGLAKPLGVAADAQGRIYVGNDGRRNVEVYEKDGTLRLVIDNGNVDQPNDLARDRQGNIYVAASRAEAVKVYSPTGQLLRDISGPVDAKLSFPAAVCIWAPSDSEAEELYVADQQHALVKVFALDGALLRSFGGKQTATEKEGRFVRLQSLALDAQGRLHALDVTANEVQILDRTSGAHISSYGSFGTAAGQLNVPLDIMFTSAGVVVTNAENHRLELLSVAP